MAEKKTYETVMKLIELTTQLENDPRERYFALMSAAALAGHIIERSPEDMVDMLMFFEGRIHLLLLETMKTKQ